MGGMVPPQVMGILNVTPDSFYDGGRHQGVDQAVDRALQMLDEGADWVDVGGESSRPGALPVGREEEQARVVPVVRGILAARPQARVSVDTVRSSTAAAALEAGARAVNDISALGDPAMAPLVASAGCELVLMHMQGTPWDMQRAPTYTDVVEEVRTWLDGRARLARAAGVDPSRILLDPGFGFGKNDLHNAALFRGLPRLVSLGYPVVVGVSRKSFIGRTLGLPQPQDRLEGSLALAALAVWQGAQVLRVHDVRATRRVVDMIAAVRPPNPGEAETC